MSGQTRCASSQFSSWFLAPSPPPAPPPLFPPWSVAPSPPVTVSTGAGPSPPAASMPFLRGPRAGARGGGSGGGGLGKNPRREIATPFAPVEEHTSHPQSPV